MNFDKIPLWTVGIAVMIFGILVSAITEGSSPDWNYLGYFYSGMWMALGLVYVAEFSYNKIKN